MATKKNKPATPNKPKPKLSAELRARMAEKARQQWSDPNSKLRTRQRDGAAELRKRPPKYAVERIEQAVAEYGATVTAICDALGCSRDLFYKWLDRYPDIKAAYERGRKIMEEKLTGFLYSQAASGYSPAAMFLLKAHFHYRDSGPVPGEKPESAEETAIKIRAALQAMKTADGMEDAPYASSKATKPQG